MDIVYSIIMQLCMQYSSFQMGFQQGVLLFVSQLSNFKEHKVKTGLWLK